MRKLGIYTSSDEKYFSIFARDEVMRSEVDSILALQTDIMDMLKIVVNMKDKATIPAFVAEEVQKLVVKHSYLNASFEDLDKSILSLARKNYLRASKVYKTKQTPFFGKVTGLR